jgi:hypothetical protein
VGDCYYGGEDTVYGGVGTYGADGPCNPQPVRQQVACPPPAGCATADDDDTPATTITATPCIPN